MSDPSISQDSVRSQYRDSNNLGARINVHQLFSTNKYGWFRFVMDQLQVLPPGARILEIGGGPAALWVAEGQRVPAGWQVTLSDYSLGMVRQAQARLTGSVRYRFAALDAQIQPFPTGTFDAVIANHMLYHVANLDATLAEIRRVLKPGGTFFAATNGRTHMEELHQLIVQFDREMRSTLGGLLEQFNLQNGAEAIGAHFNSVTLERYPDALEVTEAQPLVDYMLSMVSLSSSARLREPGVVRAFGEAVATRIRQTGSFHVEKDTGLFIAR